MKEEKFNIGLLKSKIEKIREVPQEYRIMACIGSLKDFSEAENRILRGLEEEYVNHESNDEARELLRQRHGGSKTYLFSNINSKNKISNGYFNCTGIAVIGKDKETGENISLLSHSEPDASLNEQAWLYVQYLAEALGELKIRSVPGSIDAVFFGGNYFEHRVSVRKNLQATMADDYKDAVKVAGKSIQELLEIDPLVVIGPETTSNRETTVWLDTAHRRLYITRPEQNAGKGSISFRASKVDKVF